MAPGDQLDGADAGIQNEGDGEPLQARASALEQPRKRRRERQQREQDHRQAIYGREVDRAKCQHHRERKAEVGRQGHAMQQRVARQGGELRQP
jgi:hypothetical protein